MMKTKELECISEAILHAKKTIEVLSCENYPYSAFADEDLCKMFHELKRMNMIVREKIAAAEAAASK